MLNGFKIKKLKSVKLAKIPSILYSDESIIAEIVVRYFAIGIYNIL